MNKKYLFFINLSMGLTLAIQALLHPTIENQVKTSFIIVAVVFINWAVFTWLAYSVAVRENSLPFVAKLSQSNPASTKQDWKSLLDVTTIAYQVVILLALIFLNILLVLQLTETSYLVGTILVAIILPLLIALFTNHKLNRA